MVGKKQNLKGKQTYGRVMNNAIPNNPNMHLCITGRVGDRGRRMKVEYDKPISIKVWFTVGGISRNIDGVTLMEEANGIMRIKYRARDNMKKTVLLSMANLNCIEEL
jgi:hypothetical protein